MSSTNAAILPKQVDVSRLTYSEPKVLSNGSRTVYINYSGAKLQLQTPIMHLPYGIGDWNDKDAANRRAGEEIRKKYDLNVSFRGMDGNPALKKFHDKMLELENKIKSDAFDNRQAWFRQDYDGIRKMVDMLLTPILKLDKDKDTGKVIGKYPPTMKLKLPYDDSTDSFTFECTDMDNNRQDFKDIMTRLKGGRGQFIIQLSGLWFAGGKYGCTWKVIKARLETQTQVSRVDFIQDSDEEGVAATHDDDDDLDEEAHVMAATAKRLAAVEIDEEDDDDDEPPVVRKPAAAAPAPVKKAAAAPAPAPEDDDEEDEEYATPPPLPKKPAPAKKPVPAPEPEEEEDFDSELEDEPAPPPPKKPIKKTAVSKK